MESTEATKTRTIVSEAIKNQTEQLKESASKKNKHEFDRLKMFFGVPFEAAPDLVIYEPMIGDILDYGESSFFQMLNVFISHTTQYRVQLWKKGIDWNKISDFELFASLVTQFKPDDTKPLFKDVDFSKFGALPLSLTEEQVKENEEHADDKKFKKHKPGFLLVNMEQQIIISEDIYELMAEYIRTMFNIFPKQEKVKGKRLKEEIIMIEEQENLLASQDDKKSSFLLPLISACTNHPGFKYKLQELKEVGIVQFMDAVTRLQIYESTVALNHGMYSGMCDLSKVDKKNFNFMRDISNG